MMQLKNYLTVTALTKYIKAKLEGDEHLFSILIKGEISNYVAHSRGHLYFTIKDQDAQINALMFYQDAQKLNFTPKQGDQVLISGKISVYEPRGTYSIRVSTMQLDGVGDLYLKFEALKKELEAKGYFAQIRKKEIPKFPKKIGVITSPTGAVIQDIKNTIQRRYLLTELHLYPALLQGDKSAESIAKQIALANKKNEVDVLIVGRGGGSIEDLWAFNEIAVIQAIYDSKIPVISAVGHETDYTISDFVSDLRAPTPTAAAELATPNQEELSTRIKESVEQITYRIEQHLEHRKTKLLYIDQRLENLSPSVKLNNLKLELKRNVRNLTKAFNYQLEIKANHIIQLKSGLKSPEQLINSLKERQLNLAKQLKQNIELISQTKSYQFDILKTALNALNPLSIMDKGFAVIAKDGLVITSAAKLKLDDQITIRFKDGSIGAKINRKQGK